MEGSPVWLHIFLCWGILNNLCECRHMVIQHLSVIYVKILNLNDTHVLLQTTESLTTRKYSRLCPMVLKASLYSVWSTRENKKYLSSLCSQSFLTKYIPFSSALEREEQVQHKVSSLHSRQKLFIFPVMNEEVVLIFHTIITRGAWCLCQVTSPSTFRWGKEKKRKEKKHSQKHLGTKVIGTMSQFK